MEMRAIEDIEDIGEDLTHQIPPISFSLSDSFLHSHCSSCFHPLNNPNKFPPLHPNNNNNNPINPNIFYCSQICSSLDSHTHFFSGEFHLFCIIQSQPNILSNTTTTTTTTTDIRTALRLLFFYEKNGFLSSNDRICGLLSNLEKFKNEDDGENEILGRIKEGGRLMAMARRMRDGGVSGVYEMKEYNLVEEIVLGQVLMNSVEVQGNEECYLGNAMYGPNFSWINHSCSPNACYRFLLSGSELVKEFDGSKLRIMATGEESILKTWVCDESKFNNGICGYGPRVVIRSIKPIKKGEEVCITYTDLLQPTAIRRSELWLKYRFDCCCLRCSSSPPTNIDSLLQESPAVHLEESNTCSKEAYEELTNHMDDIISEYLSVGNPKSCCEKLESILNGFQEDQLKEEPSLQNFKLHPLHYLSINAYITLASAYKIRANNLSAFHSGVDDQISEVFELCKTSAAYYILLAGVTHHLFLSESSLIPIAAHFWINAGESLLNLLRSLTRISVSSSKISGKCRSKCMLIDRLDYDLGSDLSRNKPRRFTGISSSFLGCISNIMPTVWHFLINSHHCYFKYIKDPIVFSCLGIVNDMKLTESQTILGGTDSSCFRRSCKFEDTEGIDKQRTNIAQLGIHCLLYGEFLASICYSSDCYLNRYVRKLLIDVDRWI